MKTDKQLYRNSANYFSLPFNPELRQRARALRKAGNLSEVIFWNKVKKKQFFGLDFDRQKIIGNYIVDFYCSNCNAVVEIDGSSHDRSFDYDQRRDAYLRSLGLTVIRIPIDNVMNNIEEVLCSLVEHPVFKNYLLTTPPQHSLGHPSPGGE